VSIYSTIDYLHARGAADGRERGTREGACRQLARLLLRHGKRKLGPPSADERGRLDRLADKVALTELVLARDRFLGAAGWPDLLDGLAEPDRAPADPDYLLPFKVDADPMPPSINEYMKVTRKDGSPMIIQIRLQRLYQENIGEALYREDRELRAKHGCLVQACVVLLWDGADGPAMTGEYRPPQGGVYRYDVVRVWEREVDEMFNSPSTVMFAPLGKFPPEQLPEIVRRVDEYIETQSQDEQTRQRLWAVIYSGMGLRYPAEQVNALLEHRLPYICSLKECRGTLSEGYYEGLAQGQERGALQATREWALTLGQRRLGPAPEGLASALEAIRALDRLEQIAARALTANDWPSVLAPG
jgi:hypothetical protein